MLGRAILFLISWSLAVCGLVGCSEDDTQATSDATSDATGDATGDATSDATSDVGDTSGGTSGGETPTQYTFESAFSAGQSSVSYDGQIFRHVLIEEMKTYVGGLTTAIDTNSALADEQGEIVAALNFYYLFDSAAYGEESLRFAGSMSVKQKTFNDVSKDKDLRGKIAGQDTSTDHVDWSTTFAGWSDATFAAHGGSISSPDGFVNAIFEQLEENAIAHSNGVTRQGPGGETLPIHVTEAGVDLQQLLQKFLTMSVTFHQGVDDYLDSDVADKGLLSDNTKAEDGKPFSTLEHAWDEGFGYFGAARDYGDYTDEELSAKGGRPEYAAGYHDLDGDGEIDLLSEFTFGLASNAAKRDFASKAPTDFSRDAFQGFLAGRALITSAAGRALTTEEQQALEGHRDAIALAWEKAAAATVVHYINDSIRAIDAFASPDHNFLTYAKGWSEMKGFAMGLQYNPRSPLTKVQFKAFHDLVADAPVLPNADAAAITAYRAALLDARALLGEAYGFAAENLGDDNGTNGW